MNLDKKPVKSGDQGDAVDSQSDPSVSMLNRVIGNLRILSEIGHGGMGVVYVAEHVRLPRKYAVKSLKATLGMDRGMKDRFAREARNHSLLDHPNIVRVTDFIEEKDQCFLVMDYLEGKDLGSLLKTRGSLTPSAALKIIKDVLNGLAAAHARGIIHRDIKPSNILIDARGDAHITDFGIAILGDETRLTQFDGVVGTAKYISPEQVLSPGSIDCRTDIYAVGVLFYELLTGAVPYSGETDYIIYEQHIHAPPPNPRNINPRLDVRLAEIVGHAMEKNPDSRYQTCREFLHAIEVYEPEINHEDRHKPFLLWITLAVGCALMILIGFHLYRLWTASDVQSPPGNRKHIDQAAFGLIRSASMNAMDLCRYIEALAEKKSALDIATTVGSHVNSATLDMLQASIEAEQKSINDVSLEYAHALKALVEMEQIVVEEQFDSVAHSFAQELQGKPLSYLQTVRLRYRDYYSKRTQPEFDLLAADCGKKSIEE